MTPPPPPSLPNSGIVDLVVDEERRKLLKSISRELPDVVLTDRQLCDFELLATGALSPLTGFMIRTDYESVMDRMRLQDGTLWPVPVCLALPATQAGSLEAGQSVAIRDPEGFMLGVMHLADIWPVDPGYERRQLYGDSTVPLSDGKVEAWYAGGRVEVVNLPVHFDFRQIRSTPAEVRAMAKKLGWQRIVAYQNGHTLHRNQFEMTVGAMRKAKANLLFLAETGTARTENIDFYARVKSSREAVKKYPPDAALMTLLPMVGSPPGVRGDLLRICIARNYGCTHCIIETAPEENAKDASRTRDATSLPAIATELAALAEEAGLSLLAGEPVVYLPFEDEYRPASRVPASTRWLSMPGTEIRKRVRKGRRIPGWAAFPEVVAVLQQAYPPPRLQGFTVFMTGLSGAGKSTIARILYARFLEIGGRPVTLLDGDIVRRNLSSELSFSKEHRDINVRRIGFVAAEITKNRGVAICAPIAPYARTRAEIRRSIEGWGGFVEVHVATPLEVCEHRDRKGMYAKARAGLIKGYTGVDDPYEAPESPELRIDTSDLLPDEAAQEILLFLGQKGFI